MCENRPARLRPMPPKALDRAHSACMTLVGRPMAEPRKAEPQKTAISAEADKASEKEQIKKALEQAAPGEAQREPQARPVVRKRRRVAFAVYITLLAILGVLYYL